jgi:6-phosphofructokinase 1
MGRKAGHLALGIGKAAGATLTVVPEEFPQKRISLDDVSRVIEGSIIKRRLNEQSYGVVIVAEGVGEKLDPDEIRHATGNDLNYDPYGHVTLADVPLASLIKQHVQRRFAARGDQMHITEVTLGYELRCTQPIPFDIDYTRTLGHGAVQFLLHETDDERLRRGGFVCLNGANLNVLPFSEIVDPETGRTQVRLVDINSEYYRVARDYMIRLERRNLDDDEMCRRLADAAHLTPEELRAEFASLLDYEGAFA